MNSGTSEAVTEGIRVAVRSAYVEDRSHPPLNRYFFMYTITIENHGARPVQLVNRRWIITNGHGEIEEVQGPGVVGVQPFLGPGECFEYTSACPLDTPVGSMRGTYGMVRDDGSEFDAEIQLFTLVAPHSLN